MLMFQWFHDRKKYITRSFLFQGLLGCNPSLGSCFCLSLREKCPESRWKSRFSALSGSLPFLECTRLTSPKTNNGCLFLISHYNATLYGDEFMKICYVCGKRPLIGNSIDRRGLAKKKGGVGKKITGITRRRFLPNLQRIRIVLPNGSRNRVLVCTGCIKAGLIRKAA